MPFNQNHIIVACCAAFVLYVCAFLWFIWKTNQVSVPLAPEATPGSPLNENIPVNVEAETDV